MRKSYRYQHPNLLHRVFEGQGPQGQRFGHGKELRLEKGKGVLYWAGEATTMLADMFQIESFLPSFPYYIGIGFGPVQGRELIFLFYVVTPRPHSRRVRLKEWVSFIEIDGP